MNIPHTILVVTLSTAVGTFLANFTLLWMIGRGAKREQDRRMRLIQEAEKEMMERYKEAMQKRKDYIAMES